MLAAGDSVALLSHLLGADRTRAEPNAVAALARACGHLPLALRITAARLADQQHRTITDYVTQLLAGDRIAALAVDDDLAVRAAFDQSYRTLPQVARLVFRRLGLVPYPDFTVAAAAARADVVDSEARHALEALTAAHLVVQHASGRYTMHDLLHEYAANVAAEQDSATARESATRRLYDLLAGKSSAARRAVVLGGTAVASPAGADHAGIYEYRRRDGLVGGRGPRHRGREPARTSSRPSRDGLAVGGRHA